MQKQLVLWKIHRPSGFSFKSSIFLRVPHYLAVLVAILLDPNSHWWHVNRFLDQGPFHSLGLGYANLLSGLPWRTMEWWGWNLQNRWIGATVRMCLRNTRCLILSRALSCSNHENLAQFLLWGGTGFANVMSVGLRYSTIINTRILLQYRSAQYTPKCTIISQLEGQLIPGVISALVVFACPLGQRLIGIEGEGCDGC